MRVVQSESVPSGDQAVFALNVIEHEVFRVASFMGWLNTDEFFRKNVGSYRLVRKLWLSENFKMQAILMFSFLLYFCYVHLKFKFDLIIYSLNIN